MLFTGERIVAMTDKGAHDRQNFEAQGSAFLKQNISEKPEFDYAEYRPPHSYRLAGKTLTLVLRDKPDRLGHMFGEKEVEAGSSTGTGGAGAVTAGAGRASQVKVPYEAFELAPDIFFVSYLASETRSFAVALDLMKGAATIVMGEMTDSGIISTVESARIEEIAQEGPVAYHPSFSLGGTRFLNTYAHNVAYEHIYLTGVYETWLGVKGPQAGQADTEEYHAFKIADGVYLLYWNEGILTAQMTFLFNFFQGNCVAELFARVEGEQVHSTIGAYTHLIHTKLAELPNVTRLDIYAGA
jgi:MoaF C-terminal domain/MoaF N-terminal domain